MAKNEQEVSFYRNESLKRISTQALWDIIVIGGGATGLGIALDAASRGYSTLLLEQSDFAKGTSSRSTKLVHGGVRYLAQGDVGLVYEALKERGLLFKNASHLVKNQSFIIPCYSLFDRVKYLVGLKLYDWLSGSASLGKSISLSKEEVKKELPSINPNGLLGGVKYYDGQFDDSRLAINLAQTAHEQGACLINYFRVNKLLKDKNGNINGIEAIDLENQHHYSTQAKVVINATGVFADDILQLDQPSSSHIIRPSQGVHLVFDKKFMDSSAALMIPKTSDGRVLFAVPWQGHLLVGTTDTPINQHSLEPRAMEKEIDFILKTAGLYMIQKPTRSDILSVFAGLRPLAATKNEHTTKEISRSHKIFHSKSGLFTITGGKWTTYRKMADDTLQQVIKNGLLLPVPCRTDKVSIHGNKRAPSHASFLDLYGNDKRHIEKKILLHPELAERIHPRFPYVKAQVLWAVKHEMARTLDDVLSRRIRLLITDAEAAIECAPLVAEIMAKELNRSDKWKDQQIQEFSSLASEYLANKNITQKKPLQAN